MRIDLKQVTKDNKGQPFKIGDADQTLEDVAYVALTTMTQAESMSLSRDERLKRGRLAQRIIAATDGHIDLKAEEIAMVKQCIANCYGPWIVAQTEDMLEPASAIRSA